MTEFGLLGEVSAWGPDGLVDIGHARQRSVLAALLVDANRLVSVDQLVDRVWGDRPPQTARGTLFTYLTRLRRALAPVSIERRSGGYQMTVEPGAVDLGRFSDLLAEARATQDDRQAALIYQRALALWRGEPLTDLDTPWANDVRELLLRQRFAAELDYIDVRLRLGEHAELLADLTSRATKHPLDERVVGQLILALYRSGRLAESMLRYQKFRRRLADEVGADPGPGLRDLYRRILTSDQVGPNRPRGPLPRQLPSPPASFTGRGAELAALSARIGQAAGRTPIVTIGGGGGIGKTSLAVHWAHQNMDRFPDGQLYVNLRGFDPAGRPTEPATVLRGFLSALDVAVADIPADLDAQAGLYRSLVTGRRMLVLLDNAADTAQIGLLLPGSPTVTTLVTSRHPLTALIATHGAHVVPLDTLSDDEGRELLARRLGETRLAAEPAVVTELVTHCAGLPLALAILAARASVEPDLPLAVLAAQLRDHATRLDGLDTGEADLGLRAVFSLSHQALEPGAATLARLLALAPGPDISSAGVDALAGRPAGPLVRALLSVHLVSQPVPGRYRMHDLVRLDAAERAGELPAGQRDAALRRLVGFYVRTAQTADHLLDPLRPPFDLSEVDLEVSPHALHDKEEAAAWMSAEHPCLLAAQQLAADHGWHAHVWELALVTDTWHWRQGRISDHLQVLRTAVDAAHAAGDLMVQCRLHHNIGQTMVRAGGMAEAVRHLERSIEQAEQAGMLAHQAHPHSTLAQAWSQLGDNRRAMLHATSARQLYRASGETRYEAQALNQLGWIAALLGELDDARAHCEQALELQSALGKVDGEILDSLGYINERAGRLADAIAQYEEAVTKFEDGNDTYNLATTLTQLGRACSAFGSYEKAEAAWQQALELCRVQQRTAEADALLELLEELTGSRLDGEPHVCPASEPS